MPDPLDNAADYVSDNTPVEVRSMERREITGRVVPWNTQITFRGRPESFAPGSFDGVDTSQNRLLAFHNQHDPLGKLISTENRADGQWATWRVAKTAKGDEMLALADEGILTLSPGFKTGDQAQDGTHRRVAAWPETSLVTFGAYGQAPISVRSNQGAEMPEETPAPETAPEGNTLTAEDLTALQKRQDDMFAAIEKLQASVDAPPAPTRTKSVKPFDWFHAEIERRFKDNEKPRQDLDARWEELQTRALSDITGGDTQAGDNDPADDLSGLVVEQFIASQLVNVLDARRQLFRNLGPFPMPRSGYARIPTVTQNTQVAERAGQKQAANSRKLIVETQAFEAVWFDGAVDVAIELIRTAELPILQMVWEDLLGQYALATEAGAVALLNDDNSGAAGTETFTYTEAALDTSSYGAFATDVATQAIEVRKATGAPATKLAVTEAQWPVLVAMVDANDRRQFASIGSQNADARVSLTAESFTLPGGIDVFFVPDLTDATLYNEQAIRAADGGPERVEATNVELMGRDLGLLGRTMLVPRIPAGVIVYGNAPV